MILISFLKQYFIFIVSEWLGGGLFFLLTVF